MLSKLRRLWRMYQTPTGKRMIRYTAVSVISTIISFITLSVVFGALHLWNQVGSVLFSNIVAGVASYNLNRRWVWGKQGHSHWLKEVLPFGAMSLAGMVLSLFAAAGSQHLANTHHLSHSISTLLVIAANAAAWGSLWILKFLLFNRLFGAKRAPVSVEVPVPADLVEAG